MSKVMAEKVRLQAAMGPRRSCRERFSPPSTPNKKHKDVDNDFYDVVRQDLKKLRPRALQKLYEHIQALEDVVESDKEESNGDSAVDNDQSNDDNIK